VGSSYQTILATGDLDTVRAAIADTPQAAVIRPVGPSRWAIIPEAEDGYAETEDLARYLSKATGEHAAAFDVFDSDVLVAKLFRAGAEYHEYLSDQEFLAEMWDDDGNEIMVDMLGREYAAGAEPPSGPFGADPAAFRPFGVGEVDEDRLFAALRGPESMAEQQHHDILTALHLDPGPLALDYETAAARA